MHGGRALARRVAQLLGHALGVYNVVTAIVGHALEAGAGNFACGAVSCAAGHGQCLHCISHATVVLCTADDASFTGAFDGGTRFEVRSWFAARASPWLLWAAMGGAIIAPQGLL